MTAPSTISEGVTGPKVRWAQYLLVRRTLSSTQIDGILGPVTKTAAEQSKSDGHLAVDGIFGPATWAALGGDDAQPPTLAQGSHESVVGKLQAALNDGRGDFAPGSTPVLAVDGVYDEQTATAVKGRSNWAASRWTGWSASRRGPCLCTHAVGFGTPPWDLH